MNQEFYNIVEKICEEDPRYKSDAYEFVMEGLSYTQKKFARKRHVSGEELLEGLKELLLERYGPMALSVLSHWGITKTDDFGNIVFNLIKHKVLSKTEEDKLEDFHARFDFHEVFDRGYKEELARRLGKMHLSE